MQGLGTAAALATAAAVGAAWLRGRLPEGTSPVERLTAWLLVGVALVSAIALLLADLGAFTALSLAVGVALLGGLGLLCTRRRPPGAGGPAADARPVRRRARELLLVALGALLLAVSLPAFEWVIGGRDPGTYVLAAQQMRAEHSTRAEPAYLREVPRAVLPAASLWEPDPIPGRATPPPPADPYERDLWPGFYLQEPGGVLPQGFHLFPALLAATGTASADNGLWVVPVLALLVLWSAVLLAGRLGGGPRGGTVGEAVTGFALICGLGFVWYARYPTAELLDAALLLGGVWLWTLAARAGSTWLATVAGLVAGTSLLTRPDAVIVLVALGVLALALAVRGRFDVAARRFCAGCLVAALAAALHAVLFARPYLKDVGVHSPASTPVLALIGLAALCVAAALWGLRRQVRELIDRHPGLVVRALVGSVAAGLLAAALVAQARGWLPLHWLRWYLGEAGLLLGGAGAVVLVARLARGRAPVAGWLLVLLAAITLLLYLPDAHISPDQPWGFRRFVSMLVPFWALLCGVAVAAAWSLRGGWAVPARVASVAAGGLAATQLLVGLVPTLGHREYAGAGRAVARLDRQLGPGRPVVLFGAHDVVLHRFGPAIGIGRERFALPAVRVTAPPEVEWLSQRARRAPVLLVTWGAELPPIDRRLRAEEASRLRVSLPEMERPLDRVPRRPGSLSGELVVWRLKRVQPPRARAARATSRLRPRPPGLAHPARRARGRAGAASAAGALPATHGTATR